MAVTYKTTVTGEPGRNVTGLPVPAEVISALGTQKRPPVVVTVNGYTYRTTVAVFGDVFIMALSAAHREAAGVKAGDTVEVTLALDTEPRTVEVPDDLTAALAAKPGALTAFEAQAFSKRKEFVRQVEDAKTQETRDRRIVGIVAKLGKIP